MVFVRPGTDKQQTLLCLLVLGLVASSAVVIGGALAGAAEESEASRLWTVPTVPVSLSFPLLPALILFYGGLVLLVRAWLLLRRYHVTHGLAVKTFVAVLAIWAVPLLIGPPLGSRDVYAYAAQGRAAEFGHDVYEVGPAVLGDQDPFLGPVDPLYYDTPVVYGPVFVGLSAVVSKLAGDVVIVSVLLFRLLASLGLLVAGVATFSIARRLNRDPVDALIVGLANPLVLLHLVSGAHNEAIMLALLMAGIAIGTRPRLRLLGLVLCGLAAAVKLPAILGGVFLAAPWVLGSSRWSTRLLRGGSAIISFMAVFYFAGTFTGLGWGWVGAISASEPVDAYLSVTTIFGFAASAVTGLELESVLFATRFLGYLISIVTTLFLLFRRNGSWVEALAWSLFLAALFHPTTQPWYLTWSILLLAGVYGGRRNRHLTVICIVAAFTVFPSGPRLGYVLLERSDYFSIVLGVLAVVLLTLSPKLTQPRSFGRLPSDALAGPETQARDSTVVSVVVCAEPAREDVTDFLTELRNLVLLRRRDSGTTDLRDYEVIVVDDTIVAGEGGVVDATDDVISVKTITRSAGQRWGGSGGALSDGLAAAGGSLAVVIDETVKDKAATVRRLLDAAGSGTDLCVASRSTNALANDEVNILQSGLPWLKLLAPGGPRHRFWWGGRVLCRIFFPAVARKLSDPLSGSFALRLDTIDIAELQPDGPRLLIEIAATHPNLTVSETYLSETALWPESAKKSPREIARLVGHLLELWIRTSRAWSQAPVSQRAFPRSEDTAEVLVSAES